MQPEGPTLTRLRRLVFALVVIGLGGLTLDLLLLGHHEDAWQAAPLVSLALGLAACIWNGVRGSAGSLRAFQLAMGLIAVTGLAGMGLHFSGNREFQLEMDPSQSDWTLFLKVIQAHSPPALAPAAFVQFALLGFVYAFRHPALAVSGPGKS